MWQGRFAGCVLWAARLWLFMNTLNDALTRAALRPPPPPLQDGRGSRTAVEPVSCMLACNAAPGCDSFAYNQAQQKCFLKSGAQRETCQAAETVCVSARGAPYSCGTWQTYFKQQGGPGPAAAGSPATTELLPGDGGAGRAASVQLVEAFSP